MATERGRDASSDRPERQMNRIAIYMASGKGRTPAVTDLGDKWIEMLHGQRKRADTRETSSDRDGTQMMLHGQQKGRTPAVPDWETKEIEMLRQRKRADTSSDRPGRQMNRNATWPAEKGGHQQWQTWTQLNRNGTWPAENGGNEQCRPGRQMNRNATWPAEKGGHQQKRADSSIDRPGRQMNRNATARGKGRTPPITDLGDKWIEMPHGQRKRADTSSDRPGRQMNRNATWPAEKGGASSDRPGRHMIEMLRGQQKRADSSIDRPGRQMNRNATASGKGRTPPITDLGDKWSYGQRKRADTISDRPGRQMDRNATWPAEKGRTPAVKGGHILRKNWETLKGNCLGKNLLTFFLTYRPTFFLTFIKGMSAYNLSNIIYLLYFWYVSQMSFDIMFNILSGISSNILSNNLLIFLFLLTYPLSLFKHIFYRSF